MPRATILCLMVLAAAPPASALKIQGDPCPFGYGCGGKDAVPMTSATRAQVAGILEGILTKLQSKKGLVETSGKVSKVPPSAVAAAQQQRIADLPAPVHHALQSLIASIRRNAVQAPLADAFEEMLAAQHPQQFASQRHPIDAQTKAQVASILEGILKNLSSHK